MGSKGGRPLMIFRFTTAILALVVALITLASCAAERRSRERELTPGIFETPDMDSLH